MLPPIMRTRLLIAVLVVSIHSFAPLSVVGQSNYVDSYAEECGTHVDNATIHASAGDSPRLPNGHPVEEGDTLAAYTARGTCAGYGVWKENESTFAVANATDRQGGYVEGEPLTFEVFDVSSGIAVDVDSSVTYVSCSEVVSSLCRDNGRYAPGTVHQIAAFSSESSSFELSSFTVSLDGTTAVLEWRTPSETNNTDFKVQHKAPGASAFAQLTLVEGAGTTDQPESYQVRAADLRPGTHQFRLRQIGADGSSHTTDPVSVHVEEIQKLILYAPTPMPIRQSARLTFAVKQDGPATVVLYNMLGQRVRTIYDRTTQAGRAHELSVSTHGLSSGTYFFRLRAPTGTRTQRAAVVK